MISRLLISLSLAFSISFVAFGAELRVPAFTAYLDPASGGAQVSEEAGVIEWQDPATRICWFGLLTNTGSLDCSVLARLPAGAESKLQLQVAGQSVQRTVKAAGQDPVRVAFGSFKIESPGYQRFTLESLNAKGQPFGDIEALILEGPPAVQAHFNLKPHRNAASVHLFYPAPFTNIEAFYCEVTALEDPVWTFYMACGWHRGYFGMQVNSPTERRIIFSVWDSGDEAVSRDKVSAENRVLLVARGENVYSGDFGNEGTGGHSHLKYGWKTGEKQRFIVTARPSDATHTVFSGFYFHPEKKEWILISSWKAPKEGGYLRGLHSFSENFGGGNGHLHRKALYGDQWIRLARAEWVELSIASFSHDATGKVDRIDRFMGVENGEFFLSHGGFVPGYTPFGQKFTRPVVGRAPGELVLPAIPN